MKKYVATNLNSFLNESKSITLKRKYGRKPSVTVGSKAPLRDRILSFVNENEKVSSRKLKNFIVKLNEGNKKPMDATNMWLMRNKKFFILENKNGEVNYKLSTLGKKLISINEGLNERYYIGNRERNRRYPESFERDRNLYPPVRDSYNEDYEEDYDDYEEDYDENAKKGTYDFLDTRKGHSRPGIYDMEEEMEEMEEEMYEAGQTDEDEIEELDETKKERLQKIIESIKSKRNKKLNEAEEDELTFDDLDIDNEEDSTDEKIEGEESDLENEDDKNDNDNDLEGNDKVEITDFIITVDNADDAIAELAELGVTAEKVEDEGNEEDMSSEDDLDLSDEEDLDTGSEEKSEDVLEEAEDLENGNDLESKDDLDLGGEGDDVESEDLNGGDEKIKVSVDDWEPLKGWLEEKGIDIEEMFGGEIEIEDEESEDIESEDIESDESKDDE